MGVSRILYDTKECALITFSCDADGRSPTVVRVTRSLVGESMVVGMLAGCVANASRFRALIGHRHKKQNAVSRYA